MVRVETRRSNWSRFIRIKNQQTTSSRILAASHRFPIKTNIGDALTLGTGKLAVDGVLLIADTAITRSLPRGTINIPNAVSGRKHSKSFATAAVSFRFSSTSTWPTTGTTPSFYDTARELKIPLMAGSSVPGTWRYPPADVIRNAKISEIVAFTYGTTDAYGFHGLEAVQSLAEQRRGGETGVKSVQCLSGEAVWNAMDERMFEPELFDAALKRVPSYENGKTLNRKAVPQAKLMIVTTKTAFEPSC